MSKRLPAGTTFVVPSTGVKKYTAIIPKRGGGATRVSFGDRNYSQYRDQVPRDAGGGQWGQLDTNNPNRRASYRKRHGGIMCDGARCVDVRYSPAWFSYNFLW